MTEDMVAYLKADGTLTGFIGSGANCRLEPNHMTTKDPTPPYVVYRIQANPGRVKNNVANARYYNFEIYSLTFSEAVAIGKCFKRLLDKDAGISITSTDYYIKSSWESGGYGTFETDTKLHHLTAMYAFVFVEK